MRRPAAASAAKRSSCCRAVDDCRRYAIRVDGDDAIAGNGAAIPLIHSGEATRFVAFIISAASSPVEYRSTVRRFTALRDVVRKTEAAMSGQRVEIVRLGETVTYEFTTEGQQLVLILPGCLHAFFHH